MIEWWNTLSVMMKILWAVTLSASLVFIIQSILTFIGAGSDGNLDLDVDSTGDFDSVAADASDASSHSTGMGLLTFRNFVNFILGFGWSAILLRSSIASTSVLLVVSILIGVALVFLVMMLFRWLGSMQETGNINLQRSAVGCEGKVYLKIPASRASTGKVQITINNAVREYEALTDGDALPTGTAIRVVEVLGTDTVLVEPLETLIV